MSIDSVKNRWYYKGEENMTNQQKTNIRFLRMILKKRNKVIMSAFYNHSLFVEGCNTLISEVLHREWGNEGYLLKYKLYKYLELTRNTIESEIGNYYKTVKAINAPILKEKRDNISETVKLIKKEYD